MEERKAQSTTSEAGFQVYVKQGKGGFTSETLPSQVSLLIAYLFLMDCVFLFSSVMARFSFSSPQLPNIAKYLFKMYAFLYEVLGQAELAYRSWSRK